MHMRCSVRVGSASRRNHVHWWQTQPRALSKFGWVTSDAGKSHNVRVQRQIAACTLGTTISKLGHFTSGPPFFNLGTRALCSCRFLPLTLSGASLSAAHTHTHTHTHAHTHTHTQPFSTSPQEGLPEEPGITNYPTAEVSNPTNPLMRLFLANKKPQMLDTWPLGYSIPNTLTALL